MTTRVFLSFVMAVATALGAGTHDSAARTIDDSDHVALLFAGRSVMSSNQPLIRDEAKDDRVSSSGNCVAQVADAHFAANGERPMTDDLTELQFMPIETQLLAMSEVVNESQDLINTSGLGLKRFIPAIFARLDNEGFGERVGYIAKVKATAPLQLIRNRTARPDTWETEVIKDRILGAGWPKSGSWSEIVVTITASEFQMLHSGDYSKFCLSCHGVPIGPVGASGDPKEGDPDEAISIALKE